MLKPHLCEIHDFQTLYFTDDIFIENCGLYPRQINTTNRAAYGTDFSSNESPKKIDEFISSVKISGIIASFNSLQIIINY